MPPTLTTIDDAEAAWIEALLKSSPETLRELLHPQFMAIHSPTAVIQDKEQFLTDITARPAPEDLKILTSTVRHFPGMATVSCLQEVHARFVPDAPAFVFQMGVSRVWVRDGDSWQLAHQVNYRRFPPA